MHFRLLYVVSGLRVFFVFFGHPFHMLVCIPSWDKFLLAVGRHWIVLRTWASSFSLSSQGVDVFSFSGILLSRSYAYRVMIHSTLLFWRIELYAHIMTYIQRNTYCHTLFVALPTKLHVRAIVGENWSVPHNLQTARKYVYCQHTVSWIVCSSSNMIQLTPYNWFYC